ncbi:MAG: queuosine precursor transporter, partial [Anaerolineae bacterium]
IWTGFGCALLMAVTLAVVGWLPPDPQWPHQAAYEAILGVTPRIVAGSLIAYFAGEFSNSYTLAKMKIWTRGRWLWTRTIGSTIVGEGIDTLLFVTLAFAGSMSWGVVFSIFVSNYLFKTGLEIVMTPVTYQIVGFLKRAENEDYYDYGTDFNPFRIDRERVS